MSDSQVKYANGFSASVNGIEARLLFSLSTPIIDENCKVSDVTSEDVADIRVSMPMARQIYNVLGESIRMHDEQQLNQSEPNQNSNE